MTSTFEPNVIVVLGSESGVIKPVVTSLATKCHIVRIYNHTVPEANDNCTDLMGISSLNECLDQLKISPDDQRIGFIGAAFKRQNSLFINESPADLQDMLGTNISLYVECLTILLPRMVRSKYGRLVYLSSFRSVNPVRGASIYSASKAFGETLFAGIGKEYGRFNISSVSIRMGYFESGMMEDYESSKQEMARKSIALNRFGTSEDLLAAINFSFACEYVSSGVIELNGGLNLG